MTVPLPGWCYRCEMAESTLGLGVRRWVWCWMSCVLGACHAGAAPASDPSASLQPAVLENAARPSTSTGEHAALCGHAAPCEQSASCSHAAACGETATGKQPDAPEHAVAESTPKKTVHFGEHFGAEPRVDFAALLAAPTAHADQTVQVEGVVRQVCQHRGCWLELATDLSPAAPGCRVLLKDHAFFVPIDSAGSSARLAGRVQVQAIPAPQVAHMEAEGGHFPNKQSDGSASEVRIIATGVELARK